LVFVSAGYLRSDLLAIRPDGRGDVTDTHVAWRAAKGAPLTPALLALGDELYAVNNTGLATCWDARTGQVHWQEKIGGPHSAAPVAAEDRLYFLAEDGTSTVLRAGRRFEVLATNRLGEAAFASAAVIDGSILIRTTKHLYRIAETTTAPR
jgi:outer membrane protein assembly factor BamB